MSPLLVLLPLLECCCPCLLTPLHTVTRNIKNEIEQYQSLIGLWCLSPFSWSIISSFRSESSVPNSSTAWSVKLLVPRREVQAENQLTKSKNFSLQPSESFLQDFKIVVVLDSPVAVQWCRCAKQCWVVCRQHLVHTLGCTNAHLMVCAIR